MGVGPSSFQCGAVVRSPEAVLVQPDNSCTTPPTNTDLGVFYTTDEPLGAWVAAAGLDSCSTNPPTIGLPATGSAFTVSVAQAGFCPSTTLTIPVRLEPSAEMGPAAAAVFPIGSLPLGTYTVTVTFPDQTVVNPQTQQPTSWMGSRVSGTLHIGSPLTETDTTVLVRAGKSDTFALLLDNSIAGRGAGQLVSTKTENPSVAKLSGTEYYECGTIDITGIVTYGRRDANGVSRVTGKGGIIGGTGNYEDLEGTFRVTGSYNARTKRGTLVFKGTVTY